MELVKGSLNTFLNAMTYPDKTMYPLASCNDTDFCNLMHVYLDAVFYPNIYKKEAIFRQEGWSYELESPDADLTYNGVVYNETRAARGSDRSDRLQLRELTGGDTDEEIANTLNFSIWTVRKYVKIMLEKTGFKSRTQLAVAARESGPMSTKHRSQ